MSKKSKSSTKPKQSSKIEQFNDYERSVGSFYCSKRTKANNSPWRIIFESWKDGKKKQETVPTAFYPDLGLTETMTAKQAKTAIHNYNQNRKKEVKLDYKRIKGRKRFEETKDFDKRLFQRITLKNF